MYLSIFLVGICLIGAGGFDIEEPCKTDAYPPAERTKLQNVIVNLDLPPEQRWVEIVDAKKDEIVDLIAVIKDLFPAKVVHIIDSALGSILDKLPNPYRGEIHGIATATGMPIGEAVLYNIFYEIFTACTSIVGEDKSGKMYHARNLDFGLLMGWDNKNNTWLVSEKLRKLMVNVEYQRNGKTLYKAVHFVGYIGVLTAVKQNMFTLTMNERFSLDGGYIGIIEWVLGISHGKWMGFLTRDVMENATSYTEAKNMLSTTEMLAPAYFILGGTKSGEGCIITRARESTVNTLELNPSQGRWYLLETNYDHWKKPFFIDDRRSPGMRCMNKTTQAGMGFKGLFNVLSTRPSLNKLTTYTALLQVDDGTLDTYLQQCEDPCWPW